MVNTSSIARKARDKARAVKAAGTLRRGHWNPRVNSAYHRVYLRWVDRTDYYTPRENFCHYWRVVLLYAPAHRLRTIAQAAMLAASCAIVVTAIILRPLTMLGSLALLAGAAYIMIAVRVGVHLTSKFAGSGFPSWRWLEQKGAATEAIFTLVALPIIAGYAVVMGIIAGVIYGTVVLEDDFGVYSTAWKWLIGAKLSEHKPLRWIRPWLAAPAALFVCSGVYGFWVRLLVDLGIAIGLVSVASIALYAAALAEERKEDREKETERLRRQAQIDRDNALLRAMAPVIVERLFTILHPEWAGREVMFQLWFARYEKYCHDVLGKEYWRVNLWRHFTYVRDAYEREFGRLYRLEDECRAQLAAAITVTPTLVKAKIRERHFRKTRATAIAVREILALIWQVGATLEKRTLCPFVDLPSDQPAQD